MARFRLKGKHYLNVPGMEWEQEETSPVTNKKVRRRFHVPTYLDPDDPSDCNYPGEIIVATEESREHPKDIIFVGQPTPDMEPLDDGAEEIFNSLRPKWEGMHPINDLPNTFGDALAEKFSKQLEALVSKGSNVSLSEFEQLKKSNEDLKAQVAELVKLVTPPPSAPVRRV